MTTLLCDIELGWITSKFTIGDKILKFRYKTGEPLILNQHILISDIVMANNLSINGSVACIENGIGYVAIVCALAGYDTSTIITDNIKINSELNNVTVRPIEKTKYDNLIITTQQALNNETFNLWNKIGKIYLIIDGDMLPETLSFLNSKQIKYFNISKSSNITSTSDGSRKQHKISVIEVFNFDISCKHRSKDISRTELCDSCGGSKITVQIYQCSIHNECCLGGIKYKSCLECSDRMPDEIVDAI